MPRAHNVIAGQRVKAEKLARAKELHRNMTPTERLLWQRLRANQLHGLRFRRQQVIDGFIVDFYCHAVGLVVELDGSIHQHQHEYDAERDRVLASRGLHIMRLDNADVLRDIEGALAQISAYCQGMDLSPSLSPGRGEEPGRGRRGGSSGSDRDSGSPRAGKRSQPRAPTRKPPSPGRGEEPGRGRRE
jgi:very-short-patch-repair endonuclease